MEYIEVQTMRKQASKWLPFAALHGTAEQLQKALKTRAWQKTLKQDDIARALHTFRLDKPVTSVDAWRTSRFLADNNKDLDIKDVYRTLRKGVDTPENVEKMHAVLDQRTPYGLIDFKWQLDSLSNAYKRALDTMQHQKVTPDSALITRKGLMAALPPNQQARYRNDLQEIVNLGKNVSTDNPRLTAQDVLAEFGTNNLMFHGDGPTMPRRRWLTKYHNKPVWLAPSAVTSGTYAGLGDYDNGAGLIHVFPTPKGKLGKYTWEHTTPHLQDGTGEYTEEYVRSRRKLTGADRPDRNDSNEFYEFVLRPGMKNRWLQASRNIHAPKSYYVTGRMPISSSFTVATPGLTSRLLDDVAFYDADKGIPKEVYDPWARHRREVLASVYKHYLPEGMIVRYEKPGWRTKVLR